MSQLVSKSLAVFNIFALALGIPYANSLAGRSPRACPPLGGLGIGAPGLCSTLRARTSSADSVCTQPSSDVPTPHTSTGGSALAPVLPICAAWSVRNCCIRWYALHARKRSSEQRECVRVDCAGYCRHRYSSCVTLRMRSPAANQRIQKSLSTGHQPSGGRAAAAAYASTPSGTAQSTTTRRRLSPEDSFPLASLSSLSFTSASISQRSRYPHRTLRSAPARYRPLARIAGISSQRPLSISSLVTSPFCHRA
mmetsp:Transcript_3741/g.15129  ORF Transcript_3741/g.15129 Transcript_3741/m.15129 type:complete len:252 (-) Transcript_3741:1676-2431(-)